MSLGTITFTAQEGAQPSAPSFVDRISFAGDSAYPTGGTPGFKALFNAKTKDGRTPFAVLSQGLTHEFIYDLAGDKLIAIVRATGLQVADTTDISATTETLLVFSQ